MAWYINSTRIFLQKQAGSNKNTIARLQPLAGGTVIQTFGYESEVIKLGATIVGDTDRDALKAMAQSGSTVEFKYNSTTIGNFYVSTVGWNRVMTTYQTMRPDLSCDDPVYEVDIELYE